MQSENSTKLALTKIREELNIQSEFNKQKRQLGIQFPHQLMGSKYQEWLRNFTPAEEEEAANRLRSVSSGFYSVLPLVCKGANECPHGHICPFSPKEPKGLQCPMEQQIIVERMHQFMSEYQIDGQRVSDFMLLNRLVELELTDFRCSSMLSSSSYQGVLKEVVTGSTPQGALITNEIINPIMELKEKISREKMKLLGVLVGTPQEKYKKQAALKEVKTEEYSNKISSMNKQLMDLEKKLLKAAEEAGG